MKKQTLLLLTCLLTTQLTFAAGTEQKANPPAPGEHCQIYIAGQQMSVLIHPDKDDRDIKTVYDILNLVVRPSSTAVYLKMDERSWEGNLHQASYNTISEFIKQK